MYVETTTEITEPLTVEQVKDHLRVTHNHEDQLLNRYAIAAREQCEAMTGRAFGERGLKTTFTFDGDTPNIELPYPPLTSVQTVEVNGEPATYEALEGDGAIVIIKSDLNRGDEVHIAWTAGDPVPKRATLAMLELVASWDVYRSSVTGERVRIVPHGVDRLLGTLRTWGDVA